MIALAHIYRHPIKSIGVEEVSGASLTKGRALPFDRVWGLLHEAAAPADEAGWRHKRNFLRGAASGPLMAVKARFDAASGAMTLSHPERPDLTLDLSGDLAKPSAALAAWTLPLWPQNRPAAAHLARRDAGFGDVPDPYLALIGTASIEALSAVMARPISRLRWRANLWLDGLDPFAEFDLVGKHLRIGDAELQVCARITRCVATTADPDTGKDGGDTLAALNATYGHQDLGVYAKVTRSGDIARGDAVEILT